MLSPPRAPRARSNAAEPTRTDPPVHFPSRQAGGHSQQGGWLRVHSRPHPDPV